LQGINDKGFGDFSDGFSPVASPIFDDQILGCRVADDFNNALGSPNEALLETALYFVENDRCPEEVIAPLSIARPVYDPDSPAIKTPNRYLDAIINDDRSAISKDVN
jgi:hypothetical protein